MHPTSSEREPLHPDDARAWMEDHEVQHVMEITQVSRQEAVDALVKHRTIDKAVDHLLSANDPQQVQRQADLDTVRENFGPFIASSEERGRDRERGRTASPSVSRRERDVIDLTNGKENQDPGQGQLQRSTRSPDPSWAMVPVSTSATAEATATAQDDDLNQALKMSYSEYAEDDDIPTDTAVLREDKRPIAIRADTPSRHYTSLVLSSLFYVPQVRQRCSKLRLHVTAGDDKPHSYPDNAIWSTIELFTSMDVADLSFIVESDVSQAWDAPPLAHGQTVGEVSSQFLTKIADVFQKDLDLQRIGSGPDTYKLFHFSYCRVRIPPSGPPIKIQEPNLGRVVPIEISPDAPPGGNSLVTRLSQTFNHYHEDGSSEHQLITAPSELVAFEINVRPAAVPTPSPEPLSYPKTLYLDEFLEANLDLANETRESQRRYRNQIETFMERRRKITRFEDQDTLENLRGTIDYYENIAPKGSTDYFEGVLKVDMAKRTTELQTDALKLRSILKKLEDEIKEIDRNLEELRAKLEQASDEPELRNHPYDLRAVLVHHGLPGRKQMHLYVQDGASWWKIVDYAVQEVTEGDVLSDPSGLYMGAGPFMLLYSRRQTEAEASQKVEWPQLFVTEATKNNSQLRSDLAALAAEAAMDEGI
ncbi:Glycoside hydrolase family 79 protein [Mycena kentingensis (nom. inval.)]|nr:Glycoside hydrolase family 79 protein [Mycena kentingensis (nom. inval.)]